MVPILVGLVIWYFALRRYLKKRKYVRLSRATEGRITGYKAWGAKGLLHPTIEFKNEKHKKLTGVLRSAPSKKAREQGNMRPGQTLMIRYLPDAPEKLAPNTFLFLWADVAILVWLGLLPIGVGLWSIWPYLKLQLA